MPFITDIFSFILVLIYLLAVPLLLLGVTVAIVGGFVYLVAGPEFRMQMLGWAPGVQHGVRKTLGLARALQDRPAGESE